MQYQRCYVFSTRDSVVKYTPYKQCTYRLADKSLARPGRKQARKHVRDARDFNNIETRAVIKCLFFFLQGKAPKEIHAILTETLACFLPGRVKDLSAPLYNVTLWRLRVTIVALEMQQCVLFIVEPHVTVSNMKHLVLCNNAFMTNL